MTGRLAALKTVSLGKINLAQRARGVRPGAYVRLLGPVDRPAILIGIDMLNAFESVALDFTRGQVHFRLSSSSSNREPTPPRLDRPLAALQWLFERSASMSLPARLKRELKFLKGLSRTSSA
jgi:hypothetical protein